MHLGPAPTPSAGPMPRGRTPGQVRHHTLSPSSQSELTSGRPSLLNGGGVEIEECLRKAKFEFVCARMCKAENDQRSG